MLHYPRWGRWASLSNIYMLLIVDIFWASIWHEVRRVIACLPTNHDAIMGRTLSLILYTILVFTLTRTAFNFNIIFLKSFNVTLHSSLAKVCFRLGNESLLPYLFTQHHKKVDVSSHVPSKLFLVLNDCKSLIFISNYANYNLSNLNSSFIIYLPFKIQSFSYLFRSKSSTWKLCPIQLHFRFF